MKGLVLLLCAFLILGVAACGSESASMEPLALDQRVVTDQDAPSSEPDPVEKTVTVSGPDEFISKLGDSFINPSEEDVAAFQSAGFVQAIEDTRFLPLGVVYSHQPNSPHIHTLVMQFEAADGAQTAVSILHEDSLRPCPGTCATSVEEFDVDEIPGALGTRRHASQEDIDATGDTDLHPFDDYEIDFADGVFAYRVILTGPPGSTSEAEAKDIAQSLYERVHGRPAAS